MKVEVWTEAEKLAESGSVDHYTSKPQIMNHERHITTPTKPNKLKVGWKISRIWSLWTTTPVNLKSWKAQLQPNQIYGGLSSYKTNNFFVGVLLYTALLTYRVGHECSIRTQPLHKILTLKTIFKNKIKNKNNYFK